MNTTVIPALALSCMAAVTQAGDASSCGIFVAPSGSDDADGGAAPNDPVATIGYGVERARELGVECVYIQAGEYVETVTVMSAVTLNLQGGFDVNWEQGPHTDPAHETRVYGTQQDNSGDFLTVEVLDNSNVWLRNLVIEGGDAPQKPIFETVNSVGVSVASGCGLILEDVVLYVGDGSVGARGTDGVSAADLSPAGAGGDGQNGQLVAGCDAVTRGFGGAGGYATVSFFSGGAGGLGGLADPSCARSHSMNSRDGVVGFPGGYNEDTFAPGGAGACYCGNGHGNSGSPGVEFHGFGGSGGTLDGALIASDGEDGEGGRAGGGGGGGGGGAAECAINAYGAGGGGGGAGGLPAREPGTGGVGGGGSFGIISEGAVTLLNVEILMGIGGTGGDGGFGAIGQPGGQGGAGGATPGGWAGGAGRKGGTGGHSGGGGAGAGGSSIGVMVGNEGALNVYSTSIFGGSEGAAGFPGPGNGVAPQLYGGIGEDGVYADVYFSSPDGAFNTRISADVLAAAMSRGSSACDPLPCLSTALACVADFDGDGVVGGNDLASMLSAWGGTDPKLDFDKTGQINSADLAILLAAWGPCP